MRCRFCGEVSFAGFHSEDACPKKPLERRVEVGFGDFRNNCNRLIDKQNAQVRCWLKLKGGVCPEHGKIVKGDKRG